MKAKRVKDVAKRSVKNTRRMATRAGAVPGELLRTARGGKAGSDASASGPRCSDYAATYYD